MCTIEEQEQMRAADEGMPEPCRRLRIGTRVRATLPGSNDGAEGRVVGYDPDLRLPVVEWQTDYIREAVEPDEYEVIA